MAWDESKVSALISQTSERRRQVRNLVSEGRWREAERDPERAARYFAKTVRSSTRRGAETVFGATDFQGASFLPRGAELRRAVAYVEVNSPREARLGTGFLVSPDLFLTNRHVINDDVDARATQITFDREIDDRGGTPQTSTFQLDPERFALFSPEEELDFALVAVGRRSSGSSELSVFPFCVLSNEPDKHVIGMNCNIVQHPRGLPKMISIRNNLLADRTDSSLLYETDTDEGASGAPVFSDSWELVALHHWGKPFVKMRDDQGRDVPGNVNEGIRISAIYNFLQAKLAGLNGEKRALLEKALLLFKLTTADREGPASSARRLSPPHRGSASPESFTEPSQGKPAMTSQHSGEIRVSIPLELTIRVNAPSATPAAAPAVQPKVLTPGGEAKKRDTDYSERSGFKAEFIPGLKVDLPTLGAKLAKQVGELHAGEKNAEDGILCYEHFSVMMNRSKRIAIFTATNIDGESYLIVDRKTGKVSNASEGETWYPDPRISASYYLDQTFYGAWSDYFDRGHLTRRTDPTWGDDASAERANADTFHFTNCSPQHFRFNQTTQYWQGAERYVLENGVLDDEKKKRICVIQGPIFDDTIDHWADSVQIPSSFFKVIVWKAKTGNKAVGLVVDQLALLSESRKALGQPKDVPSVNVSHWRYKIIDIEKRTGLNFGDTVRKADTFSQGRQVHVGEEAAIPIRALEDILSGAV